MDVPPHLVFDRHDEVGDENVEEDARDEEAAWAPDAAQQASLANVLREQFGAVAVFGGLLIVAGTVLQLSSSWSRNTVVGLDLVLLFACLFLLAVGTSTGIMPIFWAGLAVLVGLVVQLLFWPGSPPLWSTVALQTTGAGTLILGTVVAWRASSRDSGE